MNRRDRRRNTRSINKAPAKSNNYLLISIVGVLTLVCTIFLLYRVTTSDSVRVNTDPFHGVQLPRIASFITDGCEVCDSDTKLLEELQKTFDGQVIFKTFNVSKDSVFMTKYGATQAPAQIVLDKDGNVLAKSENSHFTKENLLDIIENIFKIDVSKAKQTE